MKRVYNRRRYMEKKRKLKKCRRVD